MKDSGKSWTRDVKDLDEETFDLSVKNPNGGEVVTHRKPEQIFKEIQELDEESAEVLAGIKKLL
jgi:type I restriction enzyme M protein